MTATRVVRTRLLQISALVTLVGSRIYGLVAEQGPPLPYVVVQQVSEVQEQHFRGPIGLREARVQIDCVAATKADAETIEALIHGDGLGNAASGLFGWRGVLGSPSQRVTLVAAAARIERFDPPELEHFVITRDYRLRWKAA